MVTWNFFLLLMAIAHLFQRVMAACPTGWTENSATNNGICYKMNINTGTGTNCAITCAGLSASMLCITSETDNDYAKSFLSSGQGMYIGYVRMVNSFFWVGGCSSTFTKWGTSKPDGGGYAGMGYLGNWDDSDSSTFYCSCQFTMSEAPTIVPTRNPTAKPTPQPTFVATLSPSVKPTTKPTLTPTAAPSTVAIDCTSYCSLIDVDPYVISAGYLLANIQLPSHFRITFDVTIAGLGVYPQLRNILSLIRSTGEDVLTVGIPDSNNLRVAYDGSIVNQWGPALTSSFTSQFTTVSTGYSYGMVQTTTSYSTYNSVGSFLDLSTTTCLVYLSKGNSDGANPTSGGMIKNLFIQGTFLYYILCW